MAAIQLESISKRYGDTVVLDTLSLTIEDGQLVVLVGPSGCGKSTLLRIIAGLLEPSEGRVLVDGKEITHLAPGERDLAMVFQSYALYPHMTVFDNIAFPLRVRRTPKPEIERRVGEVAAMLGLDELLQRKPSGLSGGQRQRVAMGRAIVRKPKAFLFDEPLSNLDAALRSRMRAEIAALHQRLGATMIYVTHDQHEAMTLADQLVLLNGGHIEQKGAPLTVYKEPRTRFVGEFIGSPPMNFLPVSRNNGSLCGDTFRLPLPEGNGASAELPHQLLLGVRPEALHVADGDQGVPATVTWVEHTGSDGYLYAEVEGTPVIARLSARAGFHIKAGDQIRLGFSEVRLFDRESGCAVS